MVLTSSRRACGAAAIYLICSILDAATAQAASVPAADTDPLAAELRVNGAVISHAQVDLLLHSIATSSGDENSPAQSEAERRLAAVSDLAIQEALAQAGAAQKLDREPEVADALAHARREILAHAYLQEYFFKNPVEEDALRAGYEYNRSNGKILEYKVHQILLPTRKEAEQVLERVRKGESLASLSKLSRDPGGNANGGLVTSSGWFRPDIFVDLYFAEAVQTLKVGVPTSKPVRSRFGWHILWMDEPARPVADPESYDKLDANVHDAMRQRETQRRINALNASLLARAKLTDSRGKVVTARSILSPP